MSTATAQNIGHITQVIGSTFDAQIPDDQLPEIYNALEVKTSSKAGDDGSSSIAP